MQKLLLATHNPAKKQELKEGFMAFFVETGHAPSLQTLDDLHITADPEETGKTFLENAQLKAEYFAKLSGLPTIADDGGIEIDALGGEPGIHSKRWLGRDATDQELIENTLLRLKDIPFEKRTAHFRIVLYYYNPLTKISCNTSASLDGKIALRVGPDAKKGFPYRALFIVDAYNKYYDELTEQEHRAVNHRLLAVQKMCKLL